MSEILCLRAHRNECVIQEENGGAGVYSADLRKHYMLDNPAWKRDIMPEIIDGKNVLDYVDPAVEVGPLNGCDRSVVSLVTLLVYSIAPAAALGFSLAGEEENSLAPA